MHAHTHTKQKKDLSNCDPSDSPLPTWPVLQGCDPRESERRPCYPSSYQSWGCCWLRSRRTPATEAAHAKLMEAPDPSWPAKKNKKIMLMSLVQCASMSSVTQIKHTLEDMWRNLLMTQRFEPYQNDFFTAEMELYQNYFFKAEMAPYSIYFITGLYKTKSSILSLCLPSGQNRFWEGWFLEGIPS